MCSVLESGNIEISTEANAWGVVSSGTYYICKIPSNCDSQFEIASITDSCSIYGLNGVRNLTSHTPMYYPTKCINTSYGRFVVCGHNSENDFFALYGIKILSGSFEYLTYTKEDIRGIVNIMQTDNENNFPQSSDRDPT